MRAKKASDLPKSVRGNESSCEVTCSISAWLTILQHLCSYLPAWLCYYCFVFFSEDEDTFMVLNIQGHLPEQSKKQILHKSLCVFEIFRM